MKKVALALLMMMALTTNAFAEEKNAWQGFWESVGGALHSAWPGNWGEKK